MSGTATQAVADTNLSTAFPLPVMRNFSSSNGSKAQVIEALKIVIQFGNLDLTGAANQWMKVAFSTKNHGAVLTTLADSDTFAVLGYQSCYHTSGGNILPSTQVFDFSDGMGNGILLATDNIYVQVTSSATSITNAFPFKLFYRIYSATVTEYVGIVQSQQ
jgi:hypothetical protein